MGIQALDPQSAQFAPGASASALSKFKNSGPIRLTIVCAVLLSVGILTGTDLFLSNLRNRVVAENERNLANTALILAEQFVNIFTAIEEVQENIIKQIRILGITDTGEFEKQLSRHDIHLKLRDNAAGVLFVGSLTIINAQGRLVNFSRQWPIPDIDASDRDFFKALQGDPEITSYLSAPVQNRANGAWVVQFARRISGPGGEFWGVTSAAIELRSIEGIFKKIALEPDSGITLFRQDGMLLARFPWTRLRTHKT